MRFLFPALFCLVTLAISPGVYAGAPFHHDITLTLAEDGRSIEITDVISPNPGDMVVNSLADNFQLLSRDEKEGTLVLRYRTKLPPIRPQTDNLGPWRGVADDQGLFLPGSANWVAGNGKPFTYRITFILPPGIKALAPGSPSKDNNSYRNDHPVTGFPVFAGPYTVREKTFGTVRVMTWFHKDLMVLADEYIEWAGGYIDLYSQQIGPYPYDAFQIVSAPLPVGLGFQNMTYMGRNVLKLPFIRYTSLAHEVLHNWWGNGVYTDYDKGNWNEGLTTFMADYALAERRKAEKARDMRFNWLRDYAALPAGQDRPVQDFRFKAHDAAQVVGYNKVAFLFYMLRLDIGARAFDKGIKTFWQEFKFKTATWGDLQKTFEQTSGKDLTPFFRQWITRKGAPKITLSNSQVTGTHDGFSVSFDLAQTAPLYHLSIPVRVTTKDGEETFIVRLHKSSQSFTIETASRPEALMIDPDFEVFRQLDETEISPVFRDLTLDPTSQYLVLTDDDAFHSAATTLAERLLGPKAAQAETIKTKTPLLVIGTLDDIKAAYGEEFFPPETIGAAAAAWMDRGHDQPLMIVAAQTEQHLKEMTRALPHYKRQSWIVFTGGGRPQKGIWPTQGSVYIKNLSNK